MLINRIKQFNKRCFCKRLKLIFLSIENGLCFTKEELDTIDKYLKKKDNDTIIADNTKKFMPSVLQTVSNIKNEALESKVKYDLLVNLNRNLIAQYSVNDVEKFNATIKEIEGLING